MCELYKYANCGGEYSTKKSEWNGNEDSCKNWNLNKPLWSFERVPCLLDLKHDLMHRSQQWFSKVKNSTTVKSIISK